LAASLTDLTNGAGADEMQYTSDQLHTFEQLKHILTSLLVVAAQPLHLKTDRSQKGRKIGAVLLLQWATTDRQTMETPVSFWSRIASPAELLPTMDELKALHNAVHHFRYCLMNGGCNIITDHKALVSVQV
jgi:hypothetical protein